MTPQLKHLPSILIAAGTVVVAAAIGVIGNIIFAGSPFAGVLLGGLLAR